jgi:hypothetical protein
MSSIPPPPTKVPLDNHQWQLWFDKIRQAAQNPSGVQWANIVFTGSNLTDIAIRNHNQLQTIQGGTANQYYHLTSNEYTYFQALPTISTKTAAYTVTLTDTTLLGDATAGAFTFTLPTAASASGKRYSFKKIDASVNVVSIKGNGTELIDGVNTQVLPTQYTRLTIQSNGTAWYIF